MSIPPGRASHELQLTVWNALYQVRDFVQYVNWIRAEDASGQALLAGLMRNHLDNGGLILAATHAPLGLDGARELRLGTPLPIPPPQGGRGQLAARARP